MRHTYYLTVEDVRRINAKFIAARADPVEAARRSALAAEQGILQVAGRIAPFTVKEINDGWASAVKRMSE